MPTNNRLRLSALVLMAVFLLTANTTAFAKETTKNKGGCPPGWSKGKKTGWKGAAVPPGQVKKSTAGKANQNKAKKDK